MRRRRDISLVGRMVAKLLDIPSSQHTDAVPRRATPPCTRRRGRRRRRSRCGATAPFIHAAPAHQDAVQALRRRARSSATGRRRARLRRLRDRAAVETERHVRRQAEYDARTLRTMLPPLVVALRLRAVNNQALRPSPTASTRATIRARSRSRRGSRATRAPSRGRGSSSR